MSILSIVGGVVAATASMQISANNVTNPGGVMTSFDQNTLTGIVRDMGWNPRTESMGGEQVVVATASNGINFILRPTVCNASGRCLGVFVFAPFPAANGERIFEFNNQVPFIKASSYGSQGSYVARYEIADGGYVRGNFRYILTNFALIARDYQTSMGGMSVSTDPDSVLADFSADSLNRSSVGQEKLVNVKFGSVYGANHSGAGVEINGAIDAASTAMLFIRSSDMSVVKAASIAPLISTPAPEWFAP
ncbi:MAG: hypothetical protein AAGA69_11910 [Pseudomonadota bacterium]